MVVVVMMMMMITRTRTTTTISNICTIKIIKTFWLKWHLIIWSPMY